MALPARAPTHGDHDVIWSSFDDGERFGEIFDRHAATIHRYLARRVGRSLADDLAGQEP